MGWKDKATAPVRGLIRKAKENDLAERVRENLPAALGIGAAAGSFYLIKDISAEIIGFQNLGKLPAYFTLLESSAVGYLAYIISNKAAYNFLFKSKSGSIDELIGGDAEKKGIVVKFRDSIKQLKNPLTFAMEHPKTASFLLTSKALYSFVIDPVYRYIYKPLVIKAHVKANSYEAISKWGLGEYERFMHDVDRTVKAASLQFVPIGVIMYVALYGVAAVALNASNALFNPRYRKCSIKRWKASHFARKKEYEKAERLLEDAIAISPAKEAYFQLADVYLRSGKIDLALKAYSDGLKAKGKKSPLDKFLETVQLVTNPHITEYKKHRKKIRKDPGDMPSYINLAALHWKLPSRHLSYGVMEKAEEKFPEKPEIKCLHSLMLESVDKEKANAKLREAFEIIKNDPAFTEKMSVVDESAHKVYELNSPFFSGMFKFKEGLKEEFFKEIMLTVYLKRLLKIEPRFNTVDPIALIDYGQKGLYIMKHADGMLLSQVKDNRADYFIAAAEALGLVHSMMPRKMTGVDYARDIEHKIRSPNALDDKERDVLLDASLGILHGIESMPRVFVKDHHAGNILVQKGSKPDEFGLILLDFDYKGTAFAGFDTSKLTEQGYNFENNAEGDMGRFIVIKRYVESFNGHEKDKCWKIPSAEEFFMHHLKSAMIKSLSFYFFSQHIRQKEFERISFIDNAVHCIDIMKEWYGEEYRSREDCYKKARETLCAMPKTNGEISARL